MQIKYIFGLITGMALILGQYSCQKEDAVEINNEIVKTWVYDAYLIDSDCEVYTAKQALDPDRHGLIFKSDGKLIIRNIDGWCATPPVSYQNYDGTWEYLNDSMVYMKHDWWGSGAGQPQQERTFKIIRLDEQQLWIKYIY